MDADIARHLCVIDPRSGEVLEQRLLDPVPEELHDPLADPRLYVFTPRPIRGDRDLAR